ncbi:MAG TPA: Wzz/FepE/Etk N-terminal domain-containing protein [Ktedonobacteraceae bacterium]|nr:Wzz/FepE/Etk N-terminal domain-containing protein [Ktedonobacteraceae bacterium]
MQPRYILGLIRKWLWLIILAALIGGAVGAGVDHILPKKYEADATLFVSSPNHIDENSVLGDQQAARALANFSQSNSVLQATLNSLHIHDLTLPQLTSMVTVQNDLDSQFVIVQVRDKGSQRAAMLASEIAKQSETQFQSKTINSTGAEFVLYQIRTIPKEISQLKQELSNIQGQSVNGTYTPEQTALINQLRASIEGLEQSYIQYVNTYDTLNGIQVTLLQDAQVPQKPVGAGSIVAIAIGMLVGLIAIVGVIIVIEQTDDILRSPSKVEKATGLRTLITVRHLHITTNQAVLLNGHNPENEDTITLQPFAAKGTHFIADQREIFDDTAKRLAIATRQVQSVRVDSRARGRASTGFQVPETFLTLGVLLRGERSQLTSSSNHNRSLLISSPEDGDGKTLIASQLALGLARVGVEVVLVDANLNNPEIHSIFGLSNVTGLSSILSSSQNGDSSSHLVDRTFAALQETHEPKLSILTSGPAVDSSPEILSSTRMKAIINLLSEKAFVIIDGPAVLTSSESVILANKSDGILIVVDARHTTASKLNLSLEMLTWVNTNILGVVLNQVSKGNEN